MTAAKLPPMLRQMLVSGGLLAVFGMAGALLLAASHAVTAPQIAANVQATLERQLHAVLPADRYSNAITEDTLRITDSEWLDALGTREPVTVYRARRDGQPTAAVFDITTPQGYSGDIRLLIATDLSGTITGVRAVSHRETPGLGDKIDLAKTDWILAFNGRSLGNPPAEDWEVKRDGGVFDQFSGATITPRAVVRQVARVLGFFEAHQRQLFEGGMGAAPNAADSNGTASS